MVLLQCSTIVWYYYRVVLGYSLWRRAAAAGWTLFWRRGWGVAAWRPWRTGLLKHKAQDVKPKTTSTTLNQVFSRHRCRSRSRFRFAEAAANREAWLCCCASRRASSAAIGWRGGTTNRRSSPIGQNGPDWPDRPRPHWTTSSPRGGGAPSSDSHLLSPGHLGDRGNRQQSVATFKIKVCHLNLNLKLKLQLIK